MPGYPKKMPLSAILTDRGGIPANFIYSSSSLSEALFMAP